jgi:hypothetical protein
MNKAAAFFCKILECLVKGLGFLVTELGFLDWSPEHSFILATLEWKDEAGLQSEVTKPRNPIPRNLGYESFVHVEFVSLVSRRSAELQSLSLEREK